MSGEHVDTTGTAGTDLLRQLSDEARRLAGGVSGPLRRLALRIEGTTVELEWHQAAPDPGGSPQPAPAGQSTAAGAQPTAAAGQPTAAAGQPTAAAGLPVTAAAREERALVRSPMVGTFYHAPAPGEPPFVSIGGTVEPDTVIGIVEAMKLLNQITADQAGVVREVLVPNGQPVEFEQPLIVLDPLPDLG
jgi:acetyl-CoA carboxylase biotin carboxyl carrier protein